MDQSMLYHKQTKKIVTLYRIALSCFVAMAYLLHFFSYTFSGSVYSIVVLALAILLLIVKPIYINHVPWFYSFWVLSLIVVLMNYLFQYRNNTVLFDFLIFLSCFLLCIAFSKKLDDYRKILHLLVIFSCFFSAGVLLQRFIPSLYNTIMRIFPSRLASAIRSHGYNAESGSGVRGFTINTNFSAGYILAGLLVLVSRMLINNKPRKKNIILLAFLILAVLYTRKRGHLLFMSIAIIMTYLIPARKTQKLKRIWNIFLVLLILLLLFYIARDALSQIPMFRIIILTFEKIESGEDFTTGRFKLFQWAIELFRKNPLFGIGWGKYRTTVAGTVVRNKSLETHNVYLQLLSETGIIGFITFVGAFFSAWFLTKNHYCECIKETDPNLSEWRSALFFSFAYQTFFMLYCLTGNPLFDQFYQIMYLFCCSIMIAYSYVKNHSEMVYPSLQEGS